MAVVLWWWRGSGGCSGDVAAGVMMLSGSLVGCGVGWRGGGGEWGELAEGRPKSRRKIGDGVGKLEREERKIRVQIQHNIMTFKALPMLKMTSLSSSLDTYSFKYPMRVADSHLQPLLYGQNTGNSYNSITLLTQPRGNPVDYCLLPLGETEERCKRKAPKGANGDATAVPRLSHDGGGCGSEEGGGDSGEMEMVMWPR
ncbi:hypothetical protein Tco_0893740 [Tanacetum coccineum]|uniref:Uncharacterized protein n=1 Tax=Tanacetum coccineum TaxID=301880 RepID=A0ABQ5CCX0_9ASTR